jgi:hypothetical protein
VVWIPIDVFKRIMKRKNRCPYPWMRVAPLLAIAPLIIALVLVATQDLMHLGQKTPQNVLFFVSTWVFALLSFCSLYFAARSFKKPVTLVARIYHLTVALALVGMTIYLWSYDVIGLRLWSY